VPAIGNFAAAGKFKPSRMMPAPQSSPAPATQLLLVEDNRSQAAMMERMLEDGSVELEVVHVGTLAVLAAEAFGDARPPVSILATDVSDRALRRAEEAVYSERSMHDVSEARRRRFFAQAGRRSKAGEQLRAMVRFGKHNLVGGPAAPLGEGPFDLILCRNVLIYFSAKTVEAVVASLEAALRP
jgi:CheY-like chemotaxis protein